MYYKDLVRQEALEGNKLKRGFVGETPFDEQQRLKREFKDAAGIENDEEDGDLFKVKKQAPKLVEDENTALKKQIAKQRSNKDAEILEQFWGDESKLDDTDKFLRKFILTNG